MNISVKRYLFYVSTCFSTNFFPFFSISAIDSKSKIQEKIKDLTAGEDAKESDRLISIFFSISMHVLSVYHNSSKQGELANVAEQSIAEFMTSFEHAENLNDSLEVELLYATECIYAKLKADNRPNKISEIMQELWDSFSFSKPTLTTKWKAERVGVDKFRGMPE